MYNDLGKNKIALGKLDEVERAREEKVPGLVNCPLEKIYYERGTIYFWLADLEPATMNFKKVIALRKELDLNTGVISYMRLGQIRDMQGRHSEAIPFYKEAIAYAPDSDTAKESKRYLESPYRWSKSQRAELKQWHR
jgi:tetratricopeptide (TPR) repeat protein